jgi:cyclopropane fatty-acyl-phospholipid synthase-like methyltransferase
MRTDSEGYSDYLQAKYLPGRRLYLEWFFYPRIFRTFTTPDAIIDLGCGTGEFLNYCRKRKHEVIGVDSNEALARRCQEHGFNIILDNICRLETLRQRRFKYVVCDNVLEHLTREELACFFNRLTELMLPGGRFVCIVPGIRGYKCDPTHQNFICSDLLNAILKDYPLRITQHYFHPINLRNVDKFLYLNMQVFEIERSR